MRHTLARLLAVLLGVLLHTSAHPGKTAPSKTYADCMDRSDGVTLNILNCMSAEFTQQDARLNRHFRAVMSTLNRQHQAGLRNAQRAWIAFRDADCDWVRRLTGGSIDRINASSCLIEKTRQRADELESLIRRDQ